MAEIKKGTLTASEISDLESMVQTFPGTKAAEDAQRKLDLNAGKTVETEEIPWYQKMLGFGEAEGAEPVSNLAAEKLAQKEYFDYYSKYGINEPGAFDEYSSLKVPELDVVHPKGGIADLDIETKPIFDVAEKYNLDPTDWNISDLVNIQQGEEEQMSPFKKWSRQFWANPGQRIMQGINMAFNPFGDIGRAITGYGLQTGQGLTQGLTNLRGGQTQRGYNLARDERNLARRIKQRTSDKTQASIEAWNNVERQRKFEEETQRLQVAQSVAQAQAATGATTVAEHWGDISQGGGYQAPSIRSAPAGVTTSSGMHGGRHYYEGGRVNFSEGGIVGLWRELSSL